MTEPVENYVAELVHATRTGQGYSESLGRWFRIGASPRASLAFDQCARALAWLKDRNYVTPEDVQGIAQEVPRHRVLLSLQAEADDVSEDQVVDELLRVVPVP